MYNVPSGPEFREFLKEYNLTSSAAARLVGKEQRAIRRYAQEENQPGARVIQWDTWALLRILTGAATVKKIREEIEAYSPSSDGRE